MVLFKRKPVHFIPVPELPQDVDLDTEVWVITETGEWFIDYEQYLDRMNYYNIKKFVCETSGNSNFTFFEALEVEKTELKMMEDNFPDPVKEPILRYISFSTIPRIDVVVDDVYAKFKEDFFPGDSVMIKTDQGNKLKGVVREKARFNAITLPDGSQRDGYCSYRVLLENNEEITVNESKRISRSRNTFTKFYVKTFLKMSIARSSKFGSPWVVKPAYAKKYRISLEYPPHLKEYELNEENKVAGSVTKKKKPGPKSKAAQGSASNHIFDPLKETPPTGPEQEAGLPLYQWKQNWYDVLKQTFVYFDDSGNSDADLVSKNKILKLFEFAGVTILSQFDHERVNFIVTLRSFNNKKEYSPDDIFHHVHDKKIKVWHHEKCFRFFKSLNITNRKIEQAQRDKLIIKDAAQLGAIDGRLASPYNQVNNGFVNILPAPGSLQTTFGPTTAIPNGKPGELMIAPKDSKFSSSTPVPRPTAKPRSVAPMNDLKLPFTSVSLVKPSWRSLEGVKDCSDILESWLFLNMYAKAFTIDTFTFDDFYTALTWTDTDVIPTLLTEVFCSLFKAYMDEDGTILVNLPKLSSRLLKKKYQLKKEEREQQNGNSTENGHANGAVENGDVSTDTVKQEEDKNGSANNKDADGDEQMEDADAEADDEGDSDEEEEEEEEEEEDIQHNAYSILEFKKISWKDKLMKRQFRDGGWVMILIGILASIEYIPHFKTDIIKIYEALAPGDYTPTLTSINENFITNLDINLRAKALAMIINVLLNGSVVRAYIEKNIEESANLRRERLDIIKELKSSIEEAQNSQKEVLDRLNSIDLAPIKARLEEEGKGENQEMTPEMIEKKKRGGRPIQNILPSQPSELEKAVCVSDPDFMLLIKNRTERIKIVDQFKVTKKSLEKSLNEIDSQRVRFLGRDRMYNRYWWFEKNGLPNLSSSVGKEDEDDENDGNDGNDSVDGLGEEEDLYIAETYLMGRLWVQGPSSTDRCSYLKFDDDASTKWRNIYADVEEEEEKEKAEREKEAKKEEEEHKAEEDQKKENTPVVTAALVDDTPIVNESTDILLKRDITPAFAASVKELFGYTFDEGEVKDSEGRVVLNRFGSAVDFAFTPMQRKLLEEGPDILLSSAYWRYIEKPEDIDRLLKWLNHNGERERLLKKELSELQDQIKNSLNSRVKSLGIGKKSEEQANLEKIIEETVISESEYQTEEETETDSSDVVVISSEEDEELTKPRTRRARAQENIKKRKRTAEMERKAAKKAKRETKPAQRIAQRESRRRKQKEREEKIRKIEDAKSRLERLETNMGRENLLNWVNSSAIDTFGYTHFDGPKISLKSNSSKNKRKGKKGGRK